MDVEEIIGVRKAQCVSASELRIELTLPIEPYSFLWDSLYNATHTEHRLTLRFLSL